MICPKCGMETSPLDNGPCLLCKTTHSGIEKIEPIKVRPRSPIHYLTPQEIIEDKLNEVIEKVNRIMEVMNRRGK